MVFNLFSEHRNIREVFLDTMIEVQTSSFSKQVANEETLESLPGDINVNDEVEESCFTDLKGKQAYLNCH